MQAHLWLSAVGFSGLMFLPTAVLLFATIAVWFDRSEKQLLGARRSIFRAAMFASLGLP
jgi:hypothetical protein